MTALPQKYRDRDQIKNQKQESQLHYPNTWFLRGQHTSVLSVQATPGSLPANTLRKSLRGYKAPDGGVTLVTEKGGKSIMDGLRKPDTYGALGGPYQDSCLINPKQSC